MKLTVWWLCPFTILALHDSANCWGFFWIILFLTLYFVALVTSRSKLSNKHERETRKQNLQKTHKAAYNVTVWSVCSGLLYKHSGPTWWPQLNWFSCICKTVDVVFSGKQSLRCFRQDKLLQSCGEKGSFVF